MTVGTEKAIDLKDKTELMWWDFIVDSLWQFRENIVGTIMMLRMQKMQEDCLGRKEKWCAHYGHLIWRHLKASIWKYIETYWKCVSALEGREINTKNAHPEVIWIKHLMETTGVCSVALKSFGEYKGENHELNLGNTCIWRHIKKGYQGTDDEVRRKQMQMLLLGALQEGWISRSSKVTRTSKRMRKIIKGTLNSAATILILLTNIFEHLFCFIPCDRHL